jgi:hypothetical protein
MSRAYNVDADGHRLEPLDLWGHSRRQVMARGAMGFYGLH